MGKQEADAIKDQVRDLLKSDLPEFYTIAKGIIKDPKAPHSARVKMLSDLLRAAEMFSADNSGRGKEPSEMTPEELQEAIETLEEKARTLQGHESIFG